MGLVLLYFLALDKKTVGAFQSRSPSRFRCRFKFASPDGFIGMGHTGRFEEQSGSGDNEVFGRSG
ncbi:MAG: hypothetical protein V2G44_06285 [bacterium JZ-2024 1]